jgi:hypothetical protein
MKNKIIFALGVGIIVLGSLVFMAGNTKAFNGYYKASNPYALASTTAVYRAANATTTIVTDVDGLQQMSYLVAVASSSTVPVLCWQNEYSNNGSDWYSQDFTYASSTSHFNQSSVYQDCMSFATSTNSTIFSKGNDGKTNFVGRRITIDRMDSQYVRTSFVNSVASMVDVQTSVKNDVVVNKN